MKSIYVDNAATEKMRKCAAEAMIPYLETVFGNPSSLHSAGQSAAAAVSNARRDVAACLGASVDEIYFTSGGSESDNQAILTAAEYGMACGKRHIISQKTEHHAVLNTLKRLERFGFEIELLDVDSNGLVTAEQVGEAIRDDTALVTIMTANNEIGTIFPVKEIAEICREKGVLFHTDAVQAVGHIIVDVGDIDCDMLSLSAHKFGGAKGVGVLYARKGIVPSCLISGGGQERGARAGTENVAGIAAMSAALKEAVSNLDKDSLYVKKMRNTLIEQLLWMPKTVLNGSKDNRLPGNVNVSFEGIEGESLLLMLDSKGICASAGSACMSGSLEASHVLRAIGRSEELSNAAIRFSLSAENTLEEIDYIVKTVKECVESLRSISPIWNG